MVELSKVEETGSRSGGCGEPVDGRFWGGIREPSAEQKWIISLRCQRHELRRTQCKESGEVEQSWCVKDKNSAASVLKGQASVFLSEKALVAQKFRLSGSTLLLD